MTSLGEYTITFNSFKEKQVAKGVAKATIKRDLRHDMYKTCLFEEKDQICEMNSIRSERHVLNVYLIRKNSLSAFDDKRHVLTNGYHTLAYGHYKI